MTKNFDAEGLCCAACAQRFEELTNKIPLTECKVMFALGRIRITAPDEHFDAIMKEVRRVGRIVEPDMVLRELRK